MGVKQHGYRLVLLGIASMSVAVNAKLLSMEVWKNPNCGCCNEWIHYMGKHGFDVKVNETGNSEMHKKLGIKEEYASCHTALVNGYVVEGHVPVEDVQRLLAEKPDAIGLAAPGMPVGSPGMDSPVYQGRQDPYQVLLIQKNGEGKVFSQHFQQEQP